MLRKLIVLAVIITIIATIRIENAFDLNSGRIRIKIAVLGFLVYNQIKETPLSQLKSQFLPGVAAEPNWYLLNRKSVINRTERNFPMGDLFHVALMLNGNNFTATQKAQMIKQIWTSLKNRDYQAITVLQEKLEHQNSVPIASPAN